MRVGITAGTTFCWGGICRTARTGAGVDGVGLRAQVITCAVGLSATAGTVLLCASLSWSSLGDVSTEALRALSDSLRTYARRLVHPSVSRTQGVRLSTCVDSSERFRSGKD